jgi:hypothetical protein
MQKIKWDGKQKQVNYQLQILLSQMGFFTNLKTKKIKFNPKPNKEKKQKIESETPEFIDLHLEVISKIDEVIKKHGLQSIKKEEPIEKTTLTQIRKPLTRTSKRSLFETEIIQDINEKDDNLFEVEKNLSFNQNIQTNNLTPLSNNVTSFNEPLTVENIDFVENIDNNPNLVKGLGLADRNVNNTTKQKAMDATITKTDLEKARHELEIRKQELEEMQKIAKQKEEELKKKEEEEKKLEKINKIKQKEIEKENRKKEKKILLEQKKQEKINKIRQKALEKERKIKEKQLLLEQERQEKINKLKEQKRLKEQELNKKLKEKEEKQKILAKKEKIEEIINKNLKEKELKQKLLEKLDKKEEIIDIEKKKEQETKQEIKTQEPEKTTIDILDEEVGEALRIIDNLLEKLPEEIIYEFIRSKDFEIYERVVNKYSKK